MRPGPRRVARVALGFILLAGFAEGVARVAFHLRGVALETARRNYWNPRRGDNFYEPHPYLSYVLRANLDLPGLHTNSLGRRGHEPRPGAFRILCVGGSTTYGTAEESEIWPVVLERELERRHPDRAIDVQNAGVPAYTSAENLLDFALRGIDLAPDVVVVLAGLNDLSPSNSPAFRSDYAHARKSLPQEPNLFDYAPAFLERSAAFIAVRHLLYQRGRYSWRGLHGLAYRRYPQDDVYRGLPTLRRNVLSLLALVRAAGAEAVLVTPPFLPRDPPWTVAMKEVVVSLREVAASHGVSLADATEALRAPTLFLDDGFHFNAEGNRLVAEAVVRAVEATGRLGEPESRPR